jgi:hypothetical protein
MLCIFTPQKTLRENAQPYRFWGLLGFPPRSACGCLNNHKGLPYGSVEKSSLTDFFMMNSLTGSSMLEKKGDYFI